MHLERAPTANSNLNEPPDVTRTICSAHDSIVAHVFSASRTTVDDLYSPESAGEGDNVNLGVRMLVL